MYIWLKVSIFYNRNHWHNLLIEGVIPFLIAMRQKKYLDKSWVYLNQKRGDNIRISFRVLSDRKSEFILFLNDHFNKYLNDRPSPDKKMNLPPVDLFKDFPNNSIQYNVYKSPGVYLEKSHSFEFENLRCFFFTYFLKIHGSELFTKNSLFELSIRLNSLMIRSYANDILTAHSLLKELLEETDFNNSYSEQLDRLDSLYRQKEKTLINIHKRVWLNDSSLSPDMDEWKCICDRLSTKGLCFKDYCFSISILIHQHLALGFSDSQWFVPLFFSYKIIAHFSREE